ncbi:MAG: glycoside hydrolase family 25 protein [Rhodospirillales bacterium]|nr:MAG: glycoside hydrolase family 25 protein [Rhodospirillales bacterium]
MIARALALAGLLLSTPAAAREMTASILDLSSHNEIGIDARLRSTHGIALIIHRATMGLDVGNFSDSDYRFDDQIKQAAAVGLRVGAYHLATRTGTGARQADDFLKLVKTTCDQLPSASRRIVLALDWEPSNGDPDNYMDVNEVAGFLTRLMARTGRTALIYSNENFFHDRKGEMMSSPHVWATLARQHLWIANYRATVDHRGRPTGASPWPNVEGLPWSTWTFWQYTDGKRSASPRMPSGRIDGVSVDRNAFNGGARQLDRFLDGIAWDCVYRSR